MRLLVVGWVAVLGLVAHGAAQDVDPDKLGPPVGDRIPAFSLADHRGAQQTLESLSGPSGLMLVFFRSADW